MVILDFSVSSFNFITVFLYILLMLVSKSSLKWYFSNIQFVWQQQGSSDMTWMKYLQPCWLTAIPMFWFKVSTVDRIYLGLAFCTYSENFCLLMGPLALLILRMIAGMSGPHLPSCCLSSSLATYHCPSVPLRTPPFFWVKWFNLTSILISL